MHNGALSLGVWRKDADIAFLLLPTHGPGKEISYKGDLFVHALFEKNTDRALNEKAPLRHGISKLSMLLGDRTANVRFFWSKHSLPSCT